MILYAWLPCSAAVNLYSALGLSSHLPWLCCSAGEACALQALPNQTALSSELGTRMRDELYTEIFQSPQRFVMVTTGGVLQLEKRRPVDVMQQVRCGRAALSRPADVTSHVYFQMFLVLTSFVVFCRQFGIYCCCRR